ncbi:MULTISPECIES: MBL fold metallo-hydrolase [Pseudomonas]|uniref:MBL fold metallo-hydrolase n=2 Tax=Pseudomonas TaxID=286 RepID=A0ABM7CUJ8_9PSED|nr:MULTISPECIES: MBL fold metallo-hydrolase [Pseudomonas]AZL70049.1 MBL fold metallo-hydrolase [Pseudomonas oryziphila]AZL75165.1 MBL fold metallo-hydrolase [Pseudomonas oryziphila]MDZ4020709.1 putative metallo-hydrolase YycJ [Pseudomonas sichuanensis]UVK81911.1 MBL fold metallo-hydrolase [Pseudomonas sichuanensis]UVL88106.1 MBL fold metallo-hydrolase [Pseudomonas sichuanensis]
MRFAVLGSGSQGNGTLIASGDTLILVDCGFSLRETERRLALLGVSATQLSAVLVTHEHADHVHGVGLLARRYNVPVYMSQGTLRGLRKPVEVAGFLSCGDTLQIGDLQVSAARVEHDAYEPLQYVISDGRRRFGMLTDLGSYDMYLLERYQALDALLIEANHCRDLLARGHYPQFLKRRVGGSQGHLNNHQAASLVAELGWQNLQHLVLAHLSSKNNQPHLARQCFVDALGCDPDWLQVANQDHGLDWRLIA